MSQVVGKTALAYARSWHHFDAKGETLGRLAVRMSLVLQGKHKPIYDPGTDCGDYVVCTNAKHVVVTGKKAQQKKYYSHSQYPGGLKVEPYERVKERNVDKIIRNAVSKQLPKNKLRDRRLERLRVYPEDEHPHAQNILKRYDLEAFTKQRESEVLAHEGGIRPEAQQAAQQQQPQQ